MKCYEGLRKSEMVLFLATMLDLENLRLNAVSQRKKDKHRMMSHMQDIKKHNRGWKMSKGNKN